MSTKSILRAVLLGSLLVLAIPHPATALPAATEEWETTIESPVDFGVSPIAYPSNAPDSVLVAVGGRIVRISGQGEVILDRQLSEEVEGGGIFDPVPADLDGDGIEEIIAGAKTGYVCALKPDGTILWQYDLDSPLDTWEMANAADLDGDGRAEVLACNLYGWIVCLDGEGVLRWRSKVEAYRPSTPAIGDIDNDGQPELVYGTATRHLIALKANGTLLWDSHQPPFHLGRTRPRIADLDGDGNAEIYSMSSMIASDTGLICLNGSDGSRKWTGVTVHKAYNGCNVVQFDDGIRGILAADKAGSVAAYAADGAFRWRTRLDGGGIWAPPSVADLDGDGKFEIVCAVRDASRDGKSNAWYVLNTEGQILAGYTHYRGYGAPLVADIDRDGVLEVVVTSKEGHVKAYSFGGPATEGAVVASVWSLPAYPLRSSKPTEAGTSSTPKNAEFVQALPEARFGRNLVRVANLPVVEAPSSTKTLGLGIEVATTFPDGTRQIEVFKTSPGARESEIAWPVWMAGAYKVDMRALALWNGVAYDTGQGALARQTLTAEVADVTTVLTAAKDIALEALDESKDLVAQTSTPEATVVLARRQAELEAALAVLKARAAAVDTMAPADRDALAQYVDDFFRLLEQTRRFAGLVAAETSAGRVPTFALWQDANPWDNVDPLDTLPTAAAPCVIEAWAFGNEIESVCVNAVNLSSRGLTLRVEPGTLAREGEDEPLMPAHNVVKLHRAVWLPSEFDETVPDVLPELGDGYLLDVAPGEVQQLWINIDTKDLEPGTYVLNWPIRTLDAAASSRALAIRLEVSSFRLPEKSRFLAGYWSQNRVEGLDTVPDLSEHLQTIWYAVPLPPAHVDAEGALVGELDWTEHDAILKEAGQIEKILYGGIPVPRFPEGTVMTDELRRTAQRNYIQALVAHLQTLGLDYENFMFYPEDEPGLRGTIEHYMARAQENKAIDPKVQNYANPWGGINVEMIEEMWPVTDVWQPGMETIEFLGPEYVAAMRKGGKPIATYTPPGNCRILRPLGFFRSQPWLALHWGIEGGGWWVYHGSDLWGTGPGQEPAYGAVTCDGRAVVASRRWEAQRDGIEDFNAVCALRDLAEAKGDEAAKKVLDEAVAHVASEALTGMPREAADYDLDYAALMAHRLRIRKALERLHP